MAKLIDILSQLIKYSNLNDKTKSRHEQAVPDTISKMCKGTRTDGGGCLIRRANRHAMDHCTLSMIDATGDMIFYNNKTGLSINTKIRASMKDDQYTTHACVSGDESICRSCSCKAGSEGNKRIFCDHVPTVGVQLSHLLPDGLAEHIMVELSTMWGSVSLSLCEITHNNIC